MSDRLGEIKARRALLADWWEEFIPPREEYTVTRCRRCGGDALDPYEGPVHKADCPVPAAVKASHDDEDWLLAEVERLRQEAAQQALRTVGLEVAATSFADGVERLRGLLARLEWAGKYWLGDDYTRECPACEVGEGMAHDEDCWLAAELR
jgi:hypothetical protein